MTLDRKSNFYYLNREDAWLDFQTHGLELIDGRLQLASVPYFEEDLAEEFAELSMPDGPAGISVSRDGTVYITDPDRDLLLTVDSCDGTVIQAQCTGGSGSHASLFSRPRGIVFHPQRNALLVSDSGNHRIEILNAESFQLMDIWGESDLGSPPFPSVEPGRFNSPTSIAVDSDGNVYVVDTGNHRVQKFDVFGRVIEEFWNAVHAILGSAAPTEVTVGTTGDNDVIYVLAPATGELYVFETNGQALHTIANERLIGAIGIAVREGAIYVGDNEQRRILKFLTDGTLIGEARGFSGTVAALAFDNNGQLLVHTGSVESGILQLSLTGAYVKNGLMWGGPFGASDPMLKAWYRLMIMAEPLAVDSHVQFFTFGSSDNVLPVVPLEADDRFSLSVWKPLPVDVTDGLIGGDLHAFLWVGAEFNGEGLTSPVLSQVRIDYDHDGYLKYFPAIYREDPIKRRFLEKFLALFESHFDDTEREIRSLCSLFDSGAAPVRFLEWLAGWLALDLDERWSEDKKRQAIAQAFELYGRRGTAEGLREALRFFAGVDALIEEPILSSSWWMLPEEKQGEGSEQQYTSLLGFGTTLAPEEAQGAVVGTTATYDESSLIGIEEFGAPLFSSVAHRFVVRVQSAQAGSTERRRQIQALIEREKPAHTVAHLCLIDPGVSIGFQARLGIDSVLGGESPMARLDHSALGGKLVLGGEPTGRVGEQSSLGKTTRLGDTKLFEA